MVSVADSEFGKRGRKNEEEMGGTEKRLRGQKAMQQVLTLNQEEARGGETEKRVRGRPCNSCFLHPSGCPVLPICNQLQCGCRRGRCDKSGRH
jgi:hypothetical protein